MMSFFFIKSRHKHAIRVGENEMIVGLCGMMGERMNSHAIKLFVAAEILMKDTKGKLLNKMWWYSHFHIHMFVWIWDEAMDINRNPFRFSPHAPPQRAWKISLILYLHRIRLLVYNYRLYIMIQLTLMSHSIIHIMTENISFLFLSSFSLLSLL